MSKADKFLKENNSYSDQLRIWQMKYMEEMLGYVNPTGDFMAFSMDSGLRQRVSQLTTLIDGKILNEDDVRLFENVGTGGTVFLDNKLSMSVGVGQYVVRQSKRVMPYFSGKSQLIEETFDNFQYESGVIKRFGYFSSNAIAPYDSNFDGYYIESDGDNNTYKLIVVNNGTETLNIDWKDWDGYDKIRDYNFQNFTVNAVDFLWLGGAVLRLFFKIGGKFQLVHTFNYAGTSQGMFMKSPNQPIRYEIRSTGGTGSMSYICCQVATEGSFSESGKTQAHFNNTSLACNSTSTTYALLGIRKHVDFRDIPTQILNCGVVNTSQNENGIVLLLQNPTLSAPLAYTPTNQVDLGLATNQTISDNGYQVAAFPSNVQGSSDVMRENFLSFLSQNINNSFDEYVLAYKPTTPNQSLHGILNFKNF